MAEGQFTVEYRELPGHVGYRVGSDGSVWSCLKRGSPSRRSVGVWRLMKTQKHPTGYLTIGLAGKVRARVHRLILLAFVGPCPPGMECRHADGNPANNLLSNLSWGTPSQNTADQIKHGTKPRGEGHTNSKLTDHLVRVLRELYTAGGISFQRLAARHGVSERVVRLAIHRQTWSHVE